MRKILNTLIVLMALTGCYKDKGNYDYKKLPTPIISDIESSYEVFVGDKLKITPKVEYADLVISNPTYSWIIGAKEVSTEKDLDITVVLTPGTIKYASFTVKDEANKIETIKKFTIKAEANFKEGWLILSEINGKGDLSYQRNDGAFYKGMYKEFNGEDLSEQPMKLREHWIPFSTKIGQINVICKGGPNYSVEIDGSNFEKIIYNKQEFINDEMPNNFAPVDACYVAYYDMLFNADGKLYVRNILSGWDANYQEGAFVNFPVYGDYELANFTMRGNIGYANDIISFDKKNKRYVIIANGEISSFNTSKDVNKAFAVEKMTKEIVAGGVNSYTSSKDIFVTILKDFVDGKYYMHRFDFSGWGTPRTFRSTSETIMAVGDLIRDDSKFAVCMFRPYIFFTNGSKLYRYNIDSNEPPLLVKDYGKKIQTIALHHKATVLGMIIGDGNVDNDFITVDVSLTGNGNILSEQKAVCGKGVDILYKVGDQWVYN